MNTGGENPSKTLFKGDNMIETVKEICPFCGEDVDMKFDTETGEYFKTLCNCGEEVDYPYQE